MTRPVENKHLTLPVRALFAIKGGPETQRQLRPALTITLNRSVRL